MKHIDIKATVWTRYYFDDSVNMNEIIKTIIDSRIEEVIDDDKGFTEAETLYDTEEKMEPIDNEGQSTIEVYENNILLWENGSNPLTNKP